jgi:transcription elongation GreA/GreB family factor
MDNAEAIKAQLYAACQQHTADRIAVLEAQLQSIQEARNNETKSTAGDKHETGRAMMQIEEKNHQAQLAEARRVQDALRHIDPSRHSDRIGPGSLVQTPNGTYFIAIGLGKVQLEAGLFYCVSAGSPIAQALSGKQAGDAVAFNGRKLVIEGVW